MKLNRLSISRLALFVLCSVTFSGLLPAQAAPRGGLQITVTKEAAPLSDEEKKDLLSRLDALKTKYPSLQANFVEQRTSHLLKKPIVSDGTIAFQTPNRFRREVKGSNPSLTVSDGKVLWIYYPNFKEAELYTLGQRAMFDDAMAALTAGLNFSKVEQFYHLNAFREKNGNYLIVLSPKKGNLKRIVTQLTVTLNPDLEILKTSLIMPKGDEVTTTYSNTKRDDLPLSTFEFKPGPDVNVSRPLGK